MFLANLGILVGVYLVQKRLMEKTPKTKIKQKTHYKKTH